MRSSKTVLHKLHVFHTTGTELTYCALSLTAKLYLGWFLLLNVIMTDGTVDEALTPVEGTVVSER